MVTRLSRTCGGFRYQTLHPSGHDLDQGRRACCCAKKAHRSACRRRGWRCRLVRGDSMDHDLLEALKGVNDPELGINIVDMGLVYRAVRTPAGIEVAFTLTTPSCPLGELLAEETREVLRRQFADAPSIQVELVWDPPWSPDRMSEAARQLL